MDFINIGDRHVSVRHIRAYEVHPDDRNETNLNKQRVSRVWIEGEADPASVTEVAHAAWIERASLPVVPAAPGWVALSYARTKTGYKVQRSPIVAWRIMHGFWNPWADQVTASPLFGIDDIEEPSVKAPDGTVWGSGTQVWPDEATWEQEMRRMADADGAAAKGEPLRP
jgi:hypothetical protein